MLQVLYYSDLSNAEFLDRFAYPGRVGLVGGKSLIETVIRRSQRRLRPDRSWSPWGHALVFSGKRVDGKHWLLESDIELHRRHFRIGVQENRVDKYHDATHYDALAVLDFGLDAAATEKVLATGLDMVATRAKYSLRELVGVYMHLKRPQKRGEKPNPLSKDKSVFCSAFVQHLYAQCGIRFAEATSDKLVTPEDIALTTVAHTAHVLRREIK